ncbi:MAG: hypothetical protein Q8K63_13010 [Acidimicrobiales bacterium]|nr:hypothetical protein [Acidimicrobiales bacterium]
MKRKTLDILFSAGGLGLAVLILVLGIVMTSNANFAHNYVKDQLSQQNIVFTPAAALTDEEKAAPCIVEYAGKALTTGKQAECYANNYIGLHIKSIADGQTYADLGAPQSALKKEIAALPAGDPKLAGLQGQLAAVTGQRESLFKGETLRGLLLTSFGFSVFGDKGAQVATVAFGAAALLALLAAAGFFHAFRTSAQEAFAPPAARKVGRKPDVAVA